MITDPPGGVTSPAATRDSLLSFAVQHPLRYLWGLVADAWIFGSTIVLALIAIAATLITRSGRPIDVIGRVWGRWIVWVCGIDLQIEGLERLRPGQSYVLISNHLSNFDIWCTLGSMPFTVRFVAKKELLRLPVFGQALALSDHIVIDRQDPQAAIDEDQRRRRAHAGGDRHPVLRRGHAQPRRQDPRVQEGRRRAWRCAPVCRSCR